MTSLSPISRGAQGLLGKIKHKARRATIENALQGGGASHHSVGVPRSAQTLLTHLTFYLNRKPIHRKNE